MTSIVKKVFKGAKRAVTGVAKGIGKIASVGFKVVKPIVKPIAKLAGKVLKPVISLGKKIARPILKGIGSIFGKKKKPEDEEPEQLGTDTQTAAQRLARSREDQLQAALLAERSGRRSGRAGFRLGRNLLKFNKNIRAIRTN